MENNVKEKLEKLCNYYTSREKCNQTMEELAELIVELSKANRGFNNRLAIIEELADVMVCIEYITHLLSIKEQEVADIMVYKINRQYDRMQEELIKTNKQGER